MNTTDAYESDPAWYISAMNVRVDSPDTLYANGRQQVLVTLLVTAMVDRKVVDLTPDEVSNLRVVDYDNPTVEYALDTPAADGWTASLDYYGYDYLGTRHPPTPAQVPGPQQQSFSFYLSGDNRAMARPIRTFAFKVKGDNGRVFYTNGNSYLSDGTPDPIFKYDIPLRINVTRPPVYDWQQFTLSEFSDLPPVPGRIKRALTTMLALVNRTSHAITAGVFNTRCTLTLRDNAGKAVPIRDAVVVPPGMITWTMNHPDDTVPSFTGYVKPGGTTIHWHSLDKVPVGSLPLPVITSPVPAASLVLCGRVNVPFTPAAFRGPCTVTVIDAAGNEHSAGVMFDPEDRSRLILTGALDT